MAPSNTRHANHKQHRLAQGTQSLPPRIPIAIMLLLFACFAATTTTFAQTESAIVGVVTESGWRSDTGRRRRGLRSFAH